ncbi:hypothetical protein Ae505Ps2_1729c [Pseudonocardia sp. Ae505_Ps2]|nr:hypothetical protein Ae505Ps2_1729c [Pseudonocardia sp. Ae505_Ps2]
MCPDGVPGGRRITPAAAGRSTRRCAGTPVGPRRTTVTAPSPAGSSGRGDAEVVTR